MIRTCICCVCLIPAFAQSALAQNPTYVSAAAVVELPTRTSTTFETSEKVQIRGLNLGVGFPLAKASLEFSGIWHTAEIDIERAGDPKIFEERIVNRDLPLVAAIRYKPFCPDRWCAEVNGGFGINFSRRSIYRMADCGTQTQPVSPCLIAGKAPPIIHNKEEPTVFIGTAVTMRVMDRLELGPSFRLWYVRRYRDLSTGNDAILSRRRTPNNERLELGVTAIWHLKRP